MPGAIPRERSQPRGRDDCAEGPEVRHARAADATPSAEQAVSEEKAGGCGSDAPKQDAPKRRPTLYDAYVNRQQALKEMVDKKAQAKAQAAGGTPAKP